MAKNLFISGNYIIVIDANKYQREFPTRNTVYNQRNNIFTIKNGQIIGQEIKIDSSDIVNWTDESGKIAYDEATFIKFLRENTGL